MRKIGKIILAVASMALLMTTTAFAAGGWKQDSVGWWYATNDAGTTWHSNGWQWIDGNSDGVAECYYFDANGYMAAGCVTPDGYTVNADGAWIVDGNVQVKSLNPNISVLDVKTEDVEGNEIAEGSSVSAILLNEELAGMIRAKGSGSGELVSNAQPYKRANFNYVTTYNGEPLEIMVIESIDQITSFYCNVETMFLNFPEQGIELDAFYKNTGFDMLDRLVTSTGNSDAIFGLPQASYRCTLVGLGEYLSAGILLTHGADGKWYIYPDSPMTIM